jgi:hypothetical protein
MKPTKSAAIGLTLVSLVFLVPQVWRTINGQPLSLTPGWAAGIGIFLAAIITFVRSRKSDGRSGPPGA